MPLWNTSPPEDPRGSGLPIIRTPAGGRILGAVTCDNLIGCPTHFYHGRTTPCEKPDCPPCNEGHGWRWHGWISALDFSNHVHFLFEFTAQASEPFVAWFEQYGTLRGCQFQARRIGTRSNSRVQILTKSLDLTKVTLPKAPDLVAVLGLLWSIPASLMQETDENTKRPVVTIDRGNGSPLPGQTTFPNMTDG